MSHDREQIRQAITSGATNARITIRIIDWCLKNVKPESHVRHAAIAQVQSVLKCSNDMAKNLVAEFLI